MRTRGRGWPVWAGIQALLAFLAIDVCASAAVGQESWSSASSESSNGWTFSLAPYAWAPAVSGTTGIKGVSTDISLSIGDVLSDVNGGLMAAFAAKNGRWSIDSDIIWASLSDSSATPRGVLFSKAKVDLDEIIWTEALGYTFLECDSYSVEAFGGFRFIWVGSDLKLSQGLLPSQSFSENKAWMDPIVGLKNEVKLSDDFFVRVRGDVGGFNASSSLTWQALAALGYKFSRWGALGAGYRAIGYNHNRDDFKYNLNEYGPFVGAEFTF